MTKTNKSAKTAAAAKAPVVDKHELTPAAKARKAKSAEKMATKPKASNQTAILSAEDQQQVANEARDRKPRGKVLTEKDIAGSKPTAKEIKAQLAKELAQEAAATGAVRASDMIAVSGPHPQSEGYYMVGTSMNNAVTIPAHKMVGTLAEAAKLGHSFKAFKEIWAETAKNSTGKLAAGLDGRNAPHSSKAVGDRAAAAKGTNKADKALAATKAKLDSKKAERKADRAAKAAPKADDNRKITIVDKKFTYGKEGTSRNASWLACTKSKTVAEYAKAGGALKYLPRWVSAGAIKLG